MGKIKRATRMASPRAAAVSRQKSNDDHSPRFSTARRDAIRAARDGDVRGDKLAMPHVDEGVLDEWLEPDEDADLDQWLHDHAEGGIDDPNR